MPTYAYACTACDHRFETFQTFSEDSLTVCPECTGRLRKVFNAVGVVFKGGGFYRTDSRSGSSSTIPAAGSGSAPGSDSSSGSSDSASSASKSGSSSASSASRSGSSSSSPKSARGAADGSAA